METKKHRLQYYANLEIISKINISMQSMKSKIDICNISIELTKMKHKQIN